jgi:acyl carrier protein
MENIELKIKDIFAKRADISKATLETNLNELDIDSLDLVETMMEIEEAFDIEFANEEIQNARTVKDIVDLVNKKKK